MALAESSQALSLAKKASRKTFAKAPAKKSGKELGKKVKRILDLERSLRQGKAQTHKKPGGPSPEDPPKIEWEPSFHLLTGRHLLEFVGEI